MKKLTGSIAIIVCILSFIAFFNFLTEPFAIQNISLTFLLLDLPFIGFLIGLVVAKRKVEKMEKELTNSNKQLRLFINATH